MSTSQEEPLLSIVIPTRNREHYLQAAIDSILAIQSLRFELVVEDNSERPRSTDWLNTHVADDRCRYYYSDATRSMGENYESGMTHTRGEYVCFIGDDDGVNPEIVLAAEWARANRLDAIVAENSAHYVWPDLRMRRGAIGPGELQIKPFSGRMEWRKPGVELSKCLADAGQEFHGLPRSYYGLIRRDCMQHVKDSAGAYFPGVSPDLASAVALTKYVETVCHIDYPLFVPGSSVQSNAGISGLNRHVGRLEDQPHLSAACTKHWSDVVPMFYSVQTVWAQSAISALVATDRRDRIMEFNVPRLYADCLFLHPRYVGYLFPTFFRALHATRLGLLNGSVQALGRYTHLWRLRCRHFVRNHVLSRPEPGRRYRVRGLSDIGQAVAAVTQYLQANNYDFQLIAR